MHKEKSRRKKLTTRAFLIRRLYGSPFGNLIGLLDQQRPRPEQTIQPTLRMELIERTRSFGKTIWVRARHTTVSKLGFITAHVEDIYEAAQEDKSLNPIPFYAVGAIACDHIKKRRLETLLFGIEPIDVPGYIVPCIIALVHTGVMYRLIAKPFDNSEIFTGDTLWVFQEKN